MTAFYLEDGKVMEAEILMRQLQSVDQGCLRWSAFADRTCYIYC